MAPPAQLEPDEFDAMVAEFDDGAGWEDPPGDQDLHEDQDLHGAEELEVFPDIPEAEDLQHDDPEAGQSSSQAVKKSQERPPPHGINYTTQRGSKPNSIFYKPLVANHAGVTYVFERMKPPKPGEPKMWYLRCSERGSKPKPPKPGKAACKARAAICNGELFISNGEPHTTCMMEGAAAKIVKLAVIEARNEMYDRAAATDETPMVMNFVVIW